MNIRVIVISADGVSEDAFGELLEAVAGGMKPVAAEPATGIGTEEADLELTDQDRELIQEEVGAAVERSAQRRRDSGHPMSSQELPETGGDALKELDRELSGERGVVPDAPRKTVLRSHAIGLRVTIDGEGEYSSAEAAGKLGCTPSAIRLAAKHHHLCKGHAVAPVGQEVPPAGVRLEGTLPDGQGRIRGPRADRVFMTCDEHPEWGQIDVEKAAKLGHCHHSAIRLGLKLERPVKGLRFRKVAAEAGKRSPNITENITEPPSEEKPAGGDAGATEENPVKLGAAREAWVVGFGPCNLRQACSKCGVNFDTLRKRLDNGGGECRNATVYWADEYLAKMAKERGR